MAYFPASCDYDCKDCSQNKCGWCAFRDCPVVATTTTAITATTVNPYNYSTTDYSTTKSDMEESK